MVKEVKSRCLVMGGWSGVWSGARSRGLEKGGGHDVWLRGRGQGAWCPAACSRTQCVIIADFHGRPVEKHVRLVVPQAHHLRHKFPREGLWKLLGGGCTHCLCRVPCDRVSALCIAKKRSIRLRAHEFAMNFARMKSLSQTMQLHPHVTHSFIAQFDWLCDFHSISTQHRHMHRLMLRHSARRPQTTLG